MSAAVCSPVMINVSLSIVAGSQQTRRMIGYSRSLATISSVTGAMLVDKVDFKNLITLEIAHMMKASEIHKGK